LILLLTLVNSPLTNPWGLPGESHQNSLGESRHGFPGDFSGSQGIPWGLLRGPPGDFSGSQGIPWGFMRELMVSPCGLFRE